MKIEHKVDYRERRRAEYPPVTQLADALYWQQNGDPSKMEAYLAKVAAVKAKYPKPNDRTEQP